MSARCRSPPESWCGYSRTRRSGSGYGNRGQQLDRLLPRVRTSRPAMNAERLLDLSPDGVHRIERGHRLLKDQADLGAAHLLHLTLAEREEVASLEENLAGCDPPRGFNQPHDGQGGQRFAAARFPDEAERLAPGNGEAHVDHRRNEPSILLEAAGEVGDREQGSGIRGQGVGCTQPLAVPRSLTPDPRSLLSFLRHPLLCARRRPIAWRQRSLQRSPWLRRPARSAARGCPSHARPR